MTTPPIGFNNLYNLSSAPAGLSMVWVATMGAAATMPGPPSRDDHGCVRNPS